MIIKKAVEDRFFDEEFDVKDLEVGQRYRMFMENDSNRKDVFLMSEICVPYSFVQIIATETGEMPLSVKSHDCTKDWIRGGMGQFELSRNIIKPGYFIIHVVNLSSWGGKDNAEIIVSRIESIESARISAPYMNIFIETVSRLKSEEVSDALHFLQKPIQFVLDRMYSNHIVRGSIPKYSKSVGRIYTTRLFCEENGKLVSSFGKSKLVLNKEMSDKDKPKSRFLKVFIPKNQKDKEVIYVDGFDLYMLTLSSYDYFEEQLLKKFSKSELHIIKTVTGDEFCAVVKEDKIFPVFHSWEGFSLVSLNEKEHGFIIEVCKLSDAVVKSN